MTSRTTASGPNSRASPHRGRAVAGAAHLPALVAQRHREQVGERRLVVDDEDAQRLPVRAAEVGAGSVERASGMAMPLIVEVPPVRHLSRSCVPAVGSPCAGTHQRWATSTTMRDPVPGPASVKTRNGSRARTPSPIVDCPSKLPAQAIWRNVCQPVTATSSARLAGR